MRVRITEDVELPESVVEAAGEGGLVLFVGAGVSISPPSDLPSFSKLAELIAGRLGRTFDQKEPADAFLGRLANEFPDTKAIAREIIGAESSAPNATHSSIARLAEAARCPIVTTNYDEHVTAAAKIAGIDLGDVFNAPAVPLARTFAGVVHLHGAVSRSAADFVLTDEDFGKAYLTDGWARRFVQDLFTNRTVLFIGYSHSDVVVTYLARGLPPNTRRYVLTHEPDHQRWTDLRITPIGYPPDDDHKALPEALDGWARLHRMGNLDHYERIRELVQGEPPKTPTEADYLTYALSVPSGVRAFAASARGEGWLRWAEAQPVFATLFDPATELSEPARMLATWFADTYIEDPARSHLAMALFARRGPFVNPHLRHLVAISCARLKDKDPALAHQWSLIVSAAMSTDQQIDEVWLSPYRNALEGAQLLPLVRRALLPRLVLTEERPWFVADDEQRDLRLKADTAWPVNDWEAQELWATVRVEFESLSAPILQIAEQAFLDAHEILRAFDPDRFDSWSFRRSAIEPHSQDQHRDTADELIDALRDAAVTQQPRDASIRPRWMTSPYPLLRRVGVHLLTEDTSITAGAKLQELLNTGLLFDHDLLHEVFRLVACIAGELDQGQRGELLAAMLIGPPPFDLDAETDARYHDRGVFDLLEWTSRHVENWPELTTEIETIRRRRPDMGVRPNPDFSHWMESGTWGGSLPMTSDEFVALADSDGPSAALRALLDRDYSERNFNEPTLRDACQVIAEGAQSRPDLAFGLLDALSPQAWLQQHDLVASVVRGWTEASLDDETAAAATAVAAELLARGDLTHPIAQFCRSVMDRGVKNRPVSLLARTDELANSIWVSHASSFEPGGWSDAFMAALNTWPGFIAQYWVHRVRVRWRMTNPWEGIDKDERRALTLMLTEAGPASKPASAILFAELNFLHAADPTFAINTLLPRFDPAAPDAREAWTAYLNGGRVAPEFLDAGLWDHLVQARRLFSTDQDQPGARQYWMALAAVAAYSPAQSVDRGELISTLAASTGQAELVTLLRSLAMTLTDEDPKQIDAMWDWVEPAWTGRIEAGLGAQSIEERAAWADLALEMRHLAPVAIGLGERAPGPFTSHTRYSEISPDVLRENAALFIESARRRVELLTSADWHVEHEITGLVTVVREYADQGALRDLADVSLARGVSSAPSWIIQ